MNNRRVTHTYAAKLLRMVVYLRPEEYRAMKLAAGERGVSASEIVREALRRCLKIED